MGVLLVAVQVLFAEVQLMYHAIFGNFMPISQVSMGGNVITNFDSQILYSIGKNIAPILLLLVPLIVTILCLALRKLRVLTVRLKWRQALATLGILLTLLLATMGIMYAGRGKSFSVYKTFTNVNTSTDSSYKSVGMLATTVQELRYMVFGSSGSVIITPSPLGTDTRRLYSSNSYNAIERIDFAKLAESTDDAMRKTTDEYLAQVVPTRKNNYTGLLQDYNLITICAESFCPWFISEELTPTLYKLSHTGIIFDNYYGTFQSVTTNGEYTMCMGLYPDMSRTKTDSSFNVAGTNYLPFCLGNALKEKGYQTWGYHDYIGDFYNRNITHANMGYTFKAADSGLDIKIDWPSSDLEMMEASVDDYLSSREPFHAYYMTFSGHYQYNWDNAMSAKNHDAVKDLPYSEPVKAYIACNLELENALTYLMDRLEQAGVADKTCIVLTNDHYPYGLTEDEYNELAGREMDLTFEKYRNSFICYVPGLSENIVVDEYCSTADILPTLLNLVGDQRVKLRLVVGMHLRLCLRGGGRFRGLRLLRGLCGRLCLPAAVLHKNIRPHGRRALCTLFGRLFGQGRIVDRQVELAHPRRAALLGPLDMLDVVRGDGVDDGLCGVLMLALRFGIFGARPVLDGGHNARDRHIEARDQTQQHPDDHHDHRADPADERREQACQPAGQHAPGRAADAAVPERGDDFPALRRVKASAYQLHQTADQRGRQKRTRYAQRDGTAVMQDEDEKAHHE